MQIEVRHISKVYRTGWIVRQRRPVLDGIDLDLAPGSRIGIVGRSGAGKTTLGLILAGILRPDQGRLRCDGVELWAADRGVRRQLGQRLQMVFQHPESTFDPRWSMVRSLEEPFRLTGRVSSETDLLEMLDAVELDHSLLDRRPGELSGGELQRMAIARALAMQPALLVLDEPTAMLDALTQAHIIRLLVSIQKSRGICMVLISHDSELVARFCHSYYRLKDGRFDEVQYQP
jgi:peptide/nickel transport system ATP-binding protein